MQMLNPQYTEETKMQQLAEDFQKAQPYKHLVLDNFLKEEAAQLLYENFPAIDALNKHYKGLNERKSEGSNFGDFHEAFKNLRAEIMSQELWEWVGKVTNIQ